MSAAALSLGKGLSLLASVILAASFTANLLSSRTDHLDAVDLALGQLEITRMEALLAIFATDEVLSGRADAVVATEALARLEYSMHSLESALGRTSIGEAGTVLESLDAIAVSLVDEDPESAGHEYTATTAPAIESVRTSLLDARDKTLADFRVIASLAGSAATAAGAVMVFLGPLALIVGYRALARRQLSKTELRVQEEATRALVESRDEFIAGLSHELRTPLTAVLGFSMILSELEDTDGETAEIAHEIGYQASELARMVEDLLVAARLGVDLASFDQEVLDPERLVSETLSLLPGATGVDVDLDPGEILGDAQRIRHVLRNLITNARAHGEPPIVIEGRLAEGRYRLSVADRGSGVEVGALPLMFDKFLHAGSRSLTAGSVGLGLHVARALVEGMGGELSYERVDGWTRFVAALPAGVHSKTRELVDA